MRTTLDLDDDILVAAKQLAQQRKMTMGQTISDLVRQAIAMKSKAKTRNGVILITPKPGGKKATLTLVNELRD